MKCIFTFIVINICLSLAAQTQSWQWVKAGGSTSDYGFSNGVIYPAECRIGGCDAYGNVYAVGWVNGPNMQFDTFSSQGAYSVNSLGISYLLFSYDCTGNMRWAKQIGDERGNQLWFGVATDPQGNTYFAGNFSYGTISGTTKLYLGDTTLPSSPMLNQRYLCMVKYDSLGKLVWFKNYESDTTYNYQHNFPYGIRIGSSGNLWMLCQLDTNYRLSSNLQTTLEGLYNVEISPDSGTILGGYYTTNAFFSTYLTDYETDLAYDLDENENFYQIGNLYNGDTLILPNQIVTATNTSVKPYIFSLDKQGNFRFIDTTKNYCLNGAFLATKWNLQAKSLVNCWLVNDGDVYGNDTFHLTNSSLGGTSRGLFAIDSGGNILYGKYLTQGFQEDIFQYLPVASYIDHMHNTGLLIYNNTDTFFSDTNATSNYTNIITRIDNNGNIIALHTVNIGAASTNAGYNMTKYGATDWRGNVYLGGTVTNYFATPADSVVNTDGQSGNFFIAKLGISDCSCPTPGVQFTQTAHGDSVSFFGSSINHRDSIHWEFGDGTVSNRDTFAHVYAHDSTYTVTAIAYSGCGVDSITKQITVRSTGIKTLEPTATNLYPNPATNSVNLDVSAPATIGLVYANGASVWQSPVQVNQQGTYVFDMSKYACAMYYFIVQYTNGKTDLMQVVKE